jgi:hypothetical protein
MTDISNEPDDQMSLVRLLTHANELDVVNIAAVTSTWKNDSIDTETIFDVISNGYAKVVDNLNNNVPKAGQYPPAEELVTRVVAGHPVYGLAALKEEHPSNASIALVKAVDASSSDEPLWAAVWGGANVLAEALDQVKRERSTEEVEEFVRKLRVYSISDQDNAGPWIRWNFPKLFYIVSIHGFSEYSIPTWIVSTSSYYLLPARLMLNPQGISGEVLRPFDKGGPDTSLVTNEWLETYIRIGPLGSYYLNWTYIMEGDTPSFLHLLPNGLNAPEHPEWGGWGGRYILADSSGETNAYSDAADFAIGKNNETFLSKYASIWRWRDAFQFDFAARMQWSVNNQNSNHHPVVVVNGSCGTAKPLEVPYKLGEAVVLDAGESWDPDEDELTFEWFHYREPTMRLEGSDIPPISPNVTFTTLDPRGSLVQVRPNENLTVHVILSVRDVRPMYLTSYTRIILNPM